MTSLICYAIQIYLYIVLARIIMSWFPPTPGTTYASIHEGVARITDPVLVPVRQLLPPFRMGTMGLDLSPIVVFLGGQLLIRIICG